MKLEKACAVCGALMLVVPSGYERKKFCSRKCLGAQRRERMRGNKYRLGLTPARGFHKGHAPWNRNLKGIHLSPHSEWKKGQPGATHVPVGTETVYRDTSGRPRMRVKIGEPNRWEMRARIIWERHHGPIPRGMVVHHKNRDKLDDRIEKLELISRADHLREHQRETRAAYAEAMLRRKQAANDTKRKAG